MLMFVMYFPLQAALMWSKKYCDSNPNIDLKEVLSNFLEFIRFHQIPANVLMREIHPLGNLIYLIINFKVFCGTHFSP